MAEFKIHRKLVQPCGKTSTAMGKTIREQESKKLQKYQGKLETMELSELQETGEPCMSTDFDQRVIISFWKPNNEMAAGQYECWHMEEIQEDVVLMPLRKQRKETDSDESKPKQQFSDKQIFFEGRDGRIFFFNEGNDV